MITFSNIGITIFRPVNFRPVKFRLGHPIPSLDQQLWTGPVSRAIRVAPDIVG